MTKFKVSNVPASVERMLIYANSVSDNYRIDHKKFPANDAEKQEKWFYELIESLPSDFLQKYEWLNMVAKGDSFSWEDAISQGSGSLFERAIKIFPHTARQIWYRYIFLNGEFREIAPLSDLSNILIQATACRRFFIRLAIMDEQPYEHKPGGKPVIPGFELNNARLTRHPTTGIIEIAAHYPIQQLISEQIDTRRIKACDSCEDFYWQKRENKNSDTNTCEKCRNKVNQRRYAEKNKNQQNSERRKNYYYKKKINFCENCVRPSEKCSCESAQEAQK